MPSRLWGRANILQSNALQILTVCKVQRLLLLPALVALGASPIVATATEQPSNRAGVALTNNDNTKPPTLGASCEGNSNLPNLIGMDIAVGREVMFENGYRPIINEDFSISWESKYFPSISELVGCSNGVPWCVFNYENDVSITILRTLGNQEIVEQEVICNVDKAE